MSKTTLAALIAVTLSSASSPVWAQDTESPAPETPPAAPAAELAPAPAATPAAEPAPVPALLGPADPVAALNDADLANMVAEEADAGPKAGSPIDIYGFMDFGYFYPILKKNSPFAAQGNKKHNFSNGNINVYLAKKISDKCRTLVEVRFLYEPNGDPDATGKKYTDTSVNDHADFNRPLRWGGVEIERAYGECDLWGGLTLRIGQWLTPYGIWNVDHGTPALIALRRPFVIGNELFPERQTGLNLLGSRSVGSFRFGYGLTLSNGRGPIEAYHDLDENKAIGARFDATYTGAIETTVGFSYYKGRYTSSDPAGVSFGMPAIIPINLQYDEQSFGLDLQINWKGLAFRGEHITNERKYTKAGRPLNANGTFAPDGSQHGYYALAGYRLPWLGIMPYFLYMEIHPLEGDPAAALGLPLRGNHYGLNILLSPFLVLKLEYMQSGIINPPPAIPAMKEKMRNIEAQIAWVF